MKKIICIFLCAIFTLGNTVVIAEVETDAKSVILIEQSTG